MPQYRDISGNGWQLPEVHITEPPGITRVRTDARLYQVGRQGEPIDTDSLVPLAIPVNSVLPAISGTPTVGSLLSVSDGTWSNSPTSYTYQWCLNGASIIGATSNTYTVAVGDVGGNLTCRVTAINADGSATAESAAVVPTAANWWLSNAIADVDYGGNKAYLIGTGETTISAVHDTSSPYAITAALRSALNVGAYVMVFEGSGLTAANSGLFGNANDRFLLQFGGDLSPVKIIMNPNAAGDQQGNVGGFSAIGDPFVAVFSCGVGGSKEAMAFNGAAAAPVTAHANRPVQAFTEGFIWNNGWSDKPSPASKVRLTIAAPEHVGGSAGNVLSDALMQSIAQNGL